MVYFLWRVYDVFLRLGFSSLCSLPQHEKTDYKAQKEFENFPEKLEAIQFMSD
jgi:hypothetical protein